MEQAFTPQVFDLQHYEIWRNTRLNKIEKILNEKQVYPVEAIKTALIKTGVYLEEASIDLLYI
jgi:hypothetical protein